jgi:serine/threonine protein phosphatase PrpC
MDQSAEAELPTLGHPEFDLLLREGRDWLAGRGELVVRSGSFRAGPISGAIHCDFGPPHQDKAVNQDYALAWLPAAVETRRRPGLVLALADGLTNSLRSECASALACWTAVRVLVEAGGAVPPKDLARLAFNEAGLTIGRLADELARAPEATCPEGQFLSTWKYILKKGGLFQTTLTLAWLDRGRFYLAMVGDGGAAWRADHGPPDARHSVDRVLAACDLESHQVCALGPADRCVRDFDCWHAEQLDGPFLGALYTDGIGRGQGPGPRALLDELERLEGAKAENPAQRFIEQAVDRRPKDFDDNLTLAVLRGT